MAWKWVLVILLLLVSSVAVGEDFQHGEFDLTTPFLLDQGDLFARPTLSASEEYTDNLYSANDFRKWDLITRVAPGVRLGVPWSRDNPPYLDVSNRIPGGVRYTNFGRPKARIFEGHLSARKSYENYKNFPAEDTSEGIVEGVLLAESKARGGVKLFGSLVDGFDPFGTGSSREQDAYQGKSVGIMLNYRAPARITLSLKGLRYTLEYDNPLRTFRDREDLVWGGGLAYRLSGKMQGVVEYQSNDIEYTTASSSDSQQTQITAGFDWRFTRKSWGAFRIGSEYRESNDETQDLFIYKVRLSYRLTPKMLLHVNSSRGSEETDLAGTRNVMVIHNRLKLFYRTSRKATVNLSLSYTETDYDNLFASGGVVDYRSDSLFGFNAGINYALYHWLLARLNYRYEERDSSFDDFDYFTNRWTFELRMSI